MTRKDAEKLRNAIVTSSKSLADDMALTVPELFDVWKPGESLAVGTRRNYNGQLYKVIQAHTTQADWTPDITPALWLKVAPAGVIPDFKQPTGAHDAYKIGDKVKFNGKTYESLINANVYSPLAYPRGWKQL